MADSIQNFRALLAMDKTLAAFWAAYLPDLMSAVQERYGQKVSADELVALPSVRINVLAQDAGAQDVFEDVESISAIEKSLAERELFRSLNDPKAGGHEEMKRKLDGMKPEERISFAREWNFSDVSLDRPSPLSGEERAELTRQLSIIRSPSERMSIARKLGLN